MLDKLIQIISFGVGGMAVSMICNVILLNFSKSLGIRNKNDVVVRWSNESKPSLGGVSFFVVFVFSSIVFSIVYYNQNIFHNKEYLGLFIASAMAFLMGLADDAYNTKPLVKLAVQISCGLLFVWSGTVIDLFHVPIVDAVFTVLWVVLIMNSLNMLDNMDGITGTTVLFILLSCLFGDWIINGFTVDIWSLTLMSIIGSVIGFLRYNIHPSKLFMGDAGSQFIGLFVAFFGVKYLWNVSSVTETNAWASILVTLVAFTPAAADTLTVVINRLKRGQSPMVGGKDHTTHHLVYAGFKDIQVWYIFVFIGFLALVFSLIMIYMIKVGVILPTIVFALYFITVFVILYRNTIKFKAKK